MSADRTTYRWEREDGEEVEIEVEFRCARYYPAVLGRAPDRCSPAEGGEVEEVEFFAGEGCSEEALKAFDREYRRGGPLSDSVDEKCFEAAQASVHDDGPDYY